MLRFLNEEDTPPNPKCVSCKCYWQPNNDDLKTDGRVYKSCRRCRKPKLTAEEIRERNNESSRKCRARKKALMADI